MTDAAKPTTPSAVRATQEQSPLPTVWPRSAQLTLVFLLGLATTLLAVHGSRGLRWGTRPMALERDASPGHRIDPNHADQAELLQIPGIGESLARRIEEERHEHGPFQNFADLRRVRGIGPTTLERLRPWMSVNGTESSNPNPRDRKSASKKEAQLTDPIDINHATAADLQRLPGIGPRRAQLIIEERRKRPFASIEELRRVSGVGAKTLERLRPYITVESGPMHIATTGGS